MADRITEARRAVDAASDATDDDAIRRQLHSIEQGLAAVGEEPNDAEKGDRLEEIESKLVGLGDETDEGAVEEYVASARDEIDAFRRDRAQDW